MEDDIFADLLPSRPIMKPPPPMRPEDVQTKGVLEGSESPNAGEGRGDKEYVVNREDSITFTKADLETLLKSSVQAAVEGAFSKFVKSLKTVLEDMSKRIDTTGQRCGELRTDLEQLREMHENEHGNYQSRFTALDVAIREVDRGVQAIRDKQELVEAQALLAKLSAKDVVAVEKPADASASATVAASSSVPPPAPTATAASTPAAAPAQPPTVVPQPIPMVVPQPTPVQQPAAAPQQPQAPLAPPPPMPTQTTEQPPPPPPAQYGQASQQPTGTPASYPYSQPPAQQPQPPPQPQPPYSQYPPQAQAGTPSMFLPTPSLAPQLPPPTPTLPPPQQLPPPPPQQHPNMSPYPATPGYPPPVPYPSPLPYRAQPAPMPLGAAPPPMPMGGQPLMATGGLPPGGPARTASRTVPLEQIISDITNMGFDRNNVVTVVNQLQRSGQSVDLNVIIDRLTNGRF